ncbi:hypothetical protein HPB48_010340 [Haemaphysalis longicornis]|uniref:Uncharacterized protein n=1 Tax=Haemaphysalis longicornis TaxID=44386 RepID=A0A9J6H474_HAELO|nr:hypothetical protein HPB48_010340 [Haemaphysalis longicornis]
MFRLRRTFPRYNDVARSRMSNQKFNVLFRPLNNVRAGDIPRRALSRLLPTIASEDTTNELTSTALNHRANFITITFYSAAEPAELCKQSQIIIGERNIVFEAQVLRPKGTSRGVIRIDPGDSNAHLHNHTTCEPANILGIRRLGKTNWALVTIDTVIPPKTVRNFTELCPVNPYVPRTLVCYRCRRDGHLHKHSPNATVSSSCGKIHGGDTCPQEVPYCNICKANGHTAVARESGTKVARIQRWQENRNVRATKERVVNLKARVFQRSRLPPSSNMAIFQLHRPDDKTMKDSWMAQLLQQLPSDSFSRCDKPTNSAVLQDSSTDKSQTIEGKVTTPGGNEPLPPVLPDHIRALHDQLVVLQRQYKEALAEYQNKEDERLDMIEERRRKIPAHLKSRHSISRPGTTALTKQDVENVVTKVIQKFLPYPPGVLDMRSSSLEKAAEDGDLGHPSRLRTTSSTIPDLTWATTNAVVNWWSETSPWGTDHCLLWIQLSSCTRATLGTK